MVGFPTARRERQIARYSERIAELTEAIKGISEPWTDIVAELERERTRLYFKRSKLIEEQEPTV